MASRRRRIIVLVTGARKLFCWAGTLEPVAPLEVCSRRFFRLPLLVHTVRAVLGADVAEPALLSAGYSGSRLVGREPAHQCYEVLLELVVYGLGRDADRTRAIASYR